MIADKFKEECAGRHFSRICRHAGLPGTRPKYRICSRVNGVIICQLLVQEKFFSSEFLSFADFFFFLGPWHRDGVKLRDLNGSLGLHQSHGCIIWNETKSSIKSIVCVLLMEAGWNRCCLSRVNYETSPCWTLAARCQKGV